MIQLVRFELEKLFSQRKAWISVVCMNMVGLGVLGLLLIPPVADSIRRSAAAALAAGFVEAEAARRMLAMLAVGWAQVFSFLALIFLALVAGALIADEFGTGSIQVLMVAPVSRAQVFAAKVAAAASFYFLAWGSGLVLLGCAYVRLKNLDPSFALDLTTLPLGRTLACYAVVDLSMLAFFLLAACVTTGEGTAFVVGIGGYLGLLFLDALLFLADQLEVLPGFVADLAAYTFTRTAGVIDFDAAYGYVSGDQPNFPLRTDLLGANVLWTAALLALAYQVFRRREVMGGS